MSFSRTNQQSYAILSDTSGRTVDISGTLLKTSIIELPALATGSNTIGKINIGTFDGSIGIADLPALPTGSNTIGKVNIGTYDSSIGIADLPALPTGSNTIGTVNIGEANAGGSDLAKAIGNPYITGHRGVASLAIRNDTLTTLSQSEEMYVPFRVNSVGALHTVASNASAVGTQLVTYTDGLLRDNSFTDQITSAMHTNLSYGDVLFAGMTASGGVAYAATLRVYLSSAAATGQTELTPTTDGSLVRTGMTLTSDAGGTFYATYNDLAAPYYSLKNESGTDICINLWSYGR